MPVVGVVVVARASPSSSPLLPPESAKMGYAPGVTNGVWTSDSGVSTGGLVEREAVVVAAAVETSPADVLDSRPAIVSLGIALARIGVASCVLRSWSWLVVAAGMSPCRPRPLLSVEASFSSTNPSIDSVVGPISPTLVSSVCPATGTSVSPFESTATFGVDTDGMGTLMAGSGSVGRDRDGVGSPWSVTVEVPLV